MKRFGMRRAVRYGGAAGVLAAVAVAVALAAATAQASSNKPYLANVHQTLNTPSSFTFTLTNDPHASQSLGSANVTPPAGFALGAVTSTGGTDAAGFNVNVVGNVVQFRAKSSQKALGPGQTVSADVTVTSGIVGCASATWMVEAKQSNDFSGQPGNDMTLNPASDLAPLGSFEIADVGTPIAVDPFFTPVILLQKYISTTTAYDTCHNVKGNYNGATLAHHGLTNATITPTTSLSWSNGTGMVDITPSVSETNNTLTVTDPTTGINDTSNFFDTQQKICTFADQGACAWQNGNGSIKANAPKPTTGSLGVGFDPVANVNFVCGSGSGGALGGTVITISPHDTSAGAYQVTLVYSKQVSGSGNANGFIFCESTDNGASFNQLPSCSVSGTGVDCVVDQKRVTGGALQVILNLLPGDPYVGGK
jgi:hypothetical protein